MNPVPPVTRHRMLENPTTNPCAFAQTHCQRISFSDPDKSYKWRSILPSSVPGPVNRMSTKCMGRPFALTVSAFLVIQHAWVSIFAIVAVIAYLAAVIASRACTISRRSLTLWREGRKLQRDCEISMRYSSRHADLAVTRSSIPRHRDTRPRAIGSSFACAAVFAAGVVSAQAVIAQDEPASSMLFQSQDPRPIRTLRELVQETRRPIEEGLVTELTFLQAIPPPKRSSGFTPRLSVGLEYNDNIFFTATQPTSDSIALISPGVNFRHESARLNLELDYSFVSSFYAENPDLNETFEEQVGFLTARYAIGERTDLDALVVGHAFKDPTSQIIPGIIPPRGTTVQNLINLSATHALAPDRGPNLRFNFRQILLDFEDQVAVNSRTYDLSAGVQFFGARRNRFDGEFRVRYFDFDSGRDVWTYAAFAGGEMELAQSLYGGLNLGPLVAAGELQETDVLVHASLRKNFRDGDLELRFERDWTTSGGVDSVLLSQILSGSAQLQLGSGVQGSVKLGLGRFESLDESDFKIWTVQPELGITYAAKPWLLFRLAYLFTWQKQDGIDSSVNSNQILFSIVGSL